MSVVDNVADGLLYSGMPLPGPPGARRRGPGAGRPRPPAAPQPRRSCPVASGSGWRSPGRSSGSPRSCSPTSPPATSTPLVGGRHGAAPRAARRGRDHRRHHPRPEIAAELPRRVDGARRPDRARQCHRRELLVSGVAVRVRAGRPVPPHRSRLHAGDVLRVGSVGLRSRPLRAGLSALGIAIGIAAMVAVLGHLRVVARRPPRLARPARHEPAHGAGGNRLRRRRRHPARRERGDDPPHRTGRGRVVGHLGRRDRAAHRPHPRGPRRAASASRRPTPTCSTPSAERSRRASGSTRSAPTCPVVVLGSVAAERLGITSLGGQPQVWIDDRWFTVIGILDRLRARAGHRPRGARRQRDRPGADRGRRRSPDDGLPAHRPGRRSTPSATWCRRPPTPTTRTRSRCRGRVRRTRGQGGSEHRVHLALPGPRRRRTARRRCRHRQRHGHLGARAAVGDRSAPGAGRHPAARQPPVPRRGAAAVGRRRHRPASSSAPP